MTHPDSQREPVQASAGIYTDTLLQSAIILTLKYGKASISLVQRHLRISYSTALGLMDAMVRANIIGNDISKDGYRDVLLRERDQTDLILRIRIEQIKAPRDQASIALVIDALRVVWEQNPSLRLGELIAKIVKPVTPCPELLNLEDSHLIEVGREMLKDG